MNENGLIKAIWERQKIEGLTLAEMASKLGISESYLCRIYQGRREPGRLFLEGVLRAYPDLQGEVTLFLSS